MKNVIKMSIISLFSFTFISVAHARETIELTTEISDVTNKVNNVFTYEIEPLQDNPQGSTNEPTTMNLEFNNETPDINNKVKKTAYIDFSQANYTKIGDYFYKVKETNSSNPDTYPLSEQEYTVIVRVTKRGGVVYKDVVNQALDNESNKTDILFAHKPQYSYIIIESYTTGNTQNLDEYFKYKLSIYGNIGDRYFISGQDETVYFEDQKINTTNYYEVKEGSDNYAYIYLKRNQKVTIGLICPECVDGGTNQIMVGTKYTLQKLSARKWQTTINNQLNSDYMEFTVGANPEKNLIVIKNEQNYDVAITGLFVNYLPYICLIAFGVISIIVIKILKSRNDDKDDKEDE